MRDEVTSALQNVKDWIADELISGNTSLDFGTEEERVIENVSCEIQSLFSGFQCELESIDIDEIRDELREVAESLESDDVERYIEDNLKSEVERKVERIVR